MLQTAPGFAQTLDGCAGNRMADIMRRVIAFDGVRNDIINLLISQSCRQFNRQISETPCLVVEYGGIDLAIGEASINRTRAGAGVLENVGGLMKSRCARSPGSVGEHEHTRPGQPEPAEDAQFVAWMRNDQRSAAIR